MNLPSFRTVNVYFPSTVTLSFASLYGYDIGTSEVEFPLYFYLKAQFSKPKIPKQHPYRDAQALQALQAPAEAKSIGEMEQPGM